MRVDRWQGLIGKELVTHCMHGFHSLTSFAILLKCRSVQFELSMDEVYTERIKSYVCKC